MKKNLLLLVFRLFVGILFLFSTSVSAQVLKDFTQRTSQYTPSTKMYYLKGNFAMIGNTNFIGVDPVGHPDANNNDGVNFVDEDNVYRTVNSSSAVLTFPMDYDANPECSEVVYAGLYWTGRSDSKAWGRDAWVLEGTSIGPDKNFKGYRLTIITSGENNENITIYTFTPQPAGSGESVVFTFNGTASSYSITAQVGSNPPVTIPATVTENNTEYTDNGVIKVRKDQSAIFESPYEISTGTNTIYIIELSKRTLNTPHKNGCSIRYKEDGAEIKMLSKHQVLFKYGDATEDTYPYQTVTASYNDIYYPVTV